MENKQLTRCAHLLKEMALKITILENWDDGVCII